MKSDHLEIVESNLGLWSYHLKIKGQKTTLCGKTNIMPTSLPMKSWGYYSGHISETYCEECSQKAFDQ